MRTENKDSEKDLNANPESRLNTNRPVTRPDSPTGGDERFPESQEAQAEIDKAKQQKKSEGKKDDSNIELLANDVAGTVSDRGTGSNPTDIAGVADIDRGLDRGRR